MACEVITIQERGMSPHMSQGHVCIWILCRSINVKHLRNCRVSAIFQIPLAGHNGIVPSSVESSCTVRAHRHWHKINIISLEVQKSSLMKDFRIYKAKITLNSVGKFFLPGFSESEPRIPGLGTAGFK